jgi:biopolymer transport protein TolQ
MPMPNLWPAGLMGDVGELISGSTLLGKVIMLVLFVMSVLSWALVVDRARRLSKAARGNVRFWEQFHAGREDAAAMRRLAGWAEQRRDSPLAVTFTWFSREFWPPYVAQRGGEGKLRTFEEMLARGVDRVAADEMARLERGVSWLATFTSIAPFVGLLGTVYGILISFLEIGHQGSASLQAVGPGIAEALVNTVAGLAVAIPAAVAYNYFVQRLKQQDNDLQQLGSLLTDLLVREELREDVVPSAFQQGRSRP